MFLVVFFYSFHFYHSPFVTQSRSQPSSKSRLDRPTMEDYDVLYKRNIKIRTADEQYQNKRITIIQTIKGYTIKLQDDEDLFYYKTVSICKLDYSSTYKKEQNIKAEFNQFPVLVIEMLNKTMAPNTGFYLQLTENHSGTKLEICENTQLRCITHLEILLANERMEVIRNNVLFTVNHYKMDLQMSEKARHELMDTIRHNEEIRKLLVRETNHLLENLLHCRAQTIRLTEKHRQNIEEHDKVNLEKFHCYEKEKEKEMLTLKITNNSLDVLCKILETENSLIKKNLSDEKEKLLVTIEAKDQLEKDIKILKAKVTKCTKELKQFQEEIPNIKKEISRLQKFEEQFELLQQDCLMAKKACNNSSRKVKECENALLERSLKIQAMSKTIENLKKEEMDTKYANALLNKKLQIDAKVIVDLRNKLQSKFFESQKRKKMNLKLENENKTLNNQILDLRHEIDFLLKRSTPPPIPDKSKEKEDLTSYLKNKYQVTDVDLDTKKMGHELERNETTKHTEYMERNTLRDGATVGISVTNKDAV